MKKIIIWLLTFFSVYSSIAQPVTSRSSPTITVADSRLMGVLNMFAPRYTDTTAANVQKGIDSAAAVIYTYDCNCLWFRQNNPKKWSHVITVDGRIDTLFAQRPAFFDSVTRFPNTILKILQGNGLVEGGRVTLDSCFSIDVAPGLISLTYNQITFAQVIRLSLAAADVFDRTDAVIVDSNGVVSILKGAAGNIAPYIDPSSQVLLATIPVPANATCLDVTQEIIYDQNTGSPEWTLTTFGTITANPNNAANPFHLSKAYFISTYTDSSALIFTKPSGNDTVHAGEILKFFPYFNGLFNNQLIGQFYLGSTPASSRIVLNPYFNINDSNQYQIGAVPLSAWSWPGGSIFNKLVLSFAGYDTSGAKGLYLDWIQLQTGILNVSDQSSGSGINIYNTDSSLAGDRKVDMNGHKLTFAGEHFGIGGNTPTDIFFEVWDGASQPYIEVDTVTGQASIQIFKGANTATMNVNATPTTTNFTIATAAVDLGSKYALIYGVADAAASSVLYTADTHTFNCKLLDANLDSVFDFTADNGAGNVVNFSGSSATKNFHMAATNGTQINQIDLFSNPDDFIEGIFLSSTDGSKISTATLYPDGSLAFGGQNAISISNDAFGSHTELHMNDSSLSLSAASSTTELNISNFVLTSRYARLYQYNHSGLDTIAKFLYHADSIAVNINNVAFFQGLGDTLKRGHLDLTTLPYAAKTGTYPITAADYTINATSGTFTTTLPTAVGITGKVYVITNSGSGVVTVATTSSQTFSNVSGTPTTLTLNQFNTATVQSNGANWLRITNL